MILITGITGYIGSHLALYFDKKKISYVGVDNLSYSYKSNINNKKNLFIADISNLKKIESILEKYNINTIIHAHHNWDSAKKKLKKEDMAKLSL